LCGQASITSTTTYSELFLTIDDGDFTRIGAHAGTLQLGQLRARALCAPEVGGAQCSALLQEGDPCPVGIGCADNLQCAKDIDGATFCEAESVGDGGAEAAAPTDAEADAPSYAGEGGGRDATSDVSAD
jgi:hypothetical protein